MSKTIAERSVDLAEANADLTAKLTAIDAEKSTLAAKVEELTAQAQAHDAALAEVQAKADEAKAESEKAAEQVTALTSERDDLVAKVQELTGTLALNPSVKQPEGCNPVAGGDTAQGGDGQGQTVTTWPQAMAACGNDYVEARNRYPDVFKKFVDNAEPKGE